MIFLSLINIDKLTNTDSLLIESYNVSNKIYKFPIFEEEYFLIENRNNQIIPGYDIDVLIIV